ncbi:hypothetical protein MMC18_004320 [Xylographa bjoerkii]|nr:hypothetical protein [Xylographa bjoerkii]
MGYCETLCQLCGVSFAIARLRRADEPLEAAWDYSGHGYIDTDEYDCCREGSGCELVGDQDIGLEHVSGPGCTSWKGYSGQRISLAEMKGCRAIQCLMQKDPSWKPEPDDQDFELESDYFLTGIGDGSPDERPLDEMKTVRHGVERIDVSNIIHDDNTVGLPIHPTCFEIFKKVSQLCLGSIDIEGLWYWRALEGSYEAFFCEFPRDYAVKNGDDQFWKHEPGSEFLAANPIEIPGFAALVIETAGYRGDRKTVFHWDYKGPSEWSVRNHRTPPPPKSGLHTPDPFTKLSAELSDMVLASLSSKDIANLRLVSPAFRQLPAILFRRLLLEDMPWFWEAQGLDVGKTNWYEMYRKVKSCWLFKGLQNRRRIWKDVEEVVRRIRKYRQEGKIKPGPVIDWLVMQD